MKALLILFTLLSALLCAQAQSIESGSTIDVSIRGVPQGEQAQVNGTYTVSPKGYITLPFIGSVKASGLNNAQLERSIAAQYRSAEIYNNPTIVVISSSNDRQKELIVTVGGFVRRPGPVTYRKGMTLYDVITQAGGRTTFGSRMIKLFRGRAVQEYDLSNNKHKMLKVYPGDTIEVRQIGPFERRD